jgi:ATP-dependent Clp protease ATP-binding subunit ClpC
MSDIFSKFTTHYQKILSRAKLCSTEAGREILNTEDLLMALALERGSLAAEILEKQGLTSLQINEKLGIPSTIIPTGINNDSSLVPLEVALIDLLNDKLSPTIKKIIEDSVLIAWKHQHYYVGTEHLLYALVTNDGDEVKTLWQKLKVDIKKLKENLSSVLKTTSKFPDLTEAFATADTKLAETDEEETDHNGATPALDFFCTDLTSTEIQHKLDPVVGREKEIRRLVNILARRTKNNPLLLGDPGVGKTAIVEGLAKKIVEGKVPDFLQNKKIYTLDLGLMIAGTMYRGEFEGRLKQLLEELKKHPEIILFIDEIHTIVGTGAAPGSLDLANLLKPALAKGLIRCIGATTQEEYKKSIESDAALERRFQVVQVSEPTPAETIEVLKGIKSNYEKFHRVHITNDAIEAAVTLSERYLPEKFLPDKAIDLLDEAASHLKTSSAPSVELKNERILLERLRQLATAKELAIKDENFPLATTYKEEENKIRQDLKKLKSSRVNETADYLGTVGRTHIAEIVSQVTNVSLNELLTEERKKLGRLEEIISNRLVGQNEAVAAIAKTIRRARLGLANPKRPMGSFIFLGPSGVGKTELAKVVAEIVMDDPQALLRLDMSEFSEAFNISKLIGAPAGYVGYKDSNKLTDAIKRRPSSVVLFDEIEKAHPDVFNLLLQILEDGQLTDAAGKQINFKNTLIIMTSNLGLQELKTQAQIGFRAAGEAQQKKFNENYGEIKEKLMVEIKKFFKPEFLNRLDGVIVFNPLTEKDLEKIVTLQIAELNSRLKEQKMGLEIKLGKVTARVIAKLTFSPDEGARGIRRFLQDKVEDPITGKLLRGDLKTPAKIIIKAKGEEIIIE